MDTNSYEIRLTDTAKEELEDIYEYISKNLTEISAANRLMDRIEQKFLNLEKNPYSCAEVHIKLRDETYRKLVIENFVALYSVNDSCKQVIVYRIIYGKMDYLKIEED